MSGNDAVCKGASEHGDVVHPLLLALGVTHAFALPSPSAAPEVLRPRQVHGVAVARVAARPDLPPGLDAETADAVVWDGSQVRPDGAGAPAGVGIVTADCVPVLAATADGRAVAAIHAGWRGLAAGVIAAGVAALPERGRAGEGIVAVIGPHIGQCCYEVDAAVIGPLEERFGRAAVARATVPSRPGHSRLSLGELALLELERADVDPDRCAGTGHCTHCGGLELASYRRDGERAGRMLHMIRPRGPLSAA